MEKHRYSLLPWKIEVHNTYTSIESKYFTVTMDVSNDDAVRIVNCVNSCEGLNPKSIPDLIKSLKHLISTIPITGNAVSMEYALNDVIRFLKQVKND